MSVLDRLRTMNGEELRFRVLSETRKAADRARSKVAPPSWARADAVRLLLHNRSSDSPDLGRARHALQRRDWLAAHQSLARHFSARSPRFPLVPSSLPQLSGRVNAQFPAAAADARSRADRMVAGFYDILGYRDVEFGVPPAWHVDPVHRRTVARSFWSEVPYLDPSNGDHKIIWEINRHQHWLGLARAHHLTGDSRYYWAVVDQLNDWMAANPPLQGINWASMLEVGFRSLSWIWALHFFAPSATSENEPASPWTVDLLLALHRHLTHVARNLSRYFSPNTHLTGEALALYAGGQALPELRGSDQWVALGREVLLQEADRQIHADGGHAELSAHYHRYTTDFYLLALRIARLTGDPAAEPFERTAWKLTNYLRTLTDDGGQLPLIGDDDGGQLFPICQRPPYDCRDTLAAAALILNAPDLSVGEAPEEVYWLCGDLPVEKLSGQRAGRASIPLADTGYYVSRNAAGDHLVFDAGRHGYLNGGHAHADALSIVLTVRGRPLLIDPGTGTYTMDLGLRDRFRSTAMHNTVVVNDRSQSEPRGPFHWQTTACGRATFWQSASGFDYAEGRHDGYRPMVHLRGVLAIHDVGWFVVDHLLGSGDATVENFWHIHPIWNVSESDGHIELHSSDLAVNLASSAALLPPDPAAELGTYSPLYGRIDQGPVLRSRTRGPMPRSWLTCLLPRVEDRTNAGSATISALAIDIKPPREWHAVGFEISAGSRRLAVLAAVSIDDTIISAGPSQLWGCAAVQTDGRLAVVDLDAPEPLAIVGGTTAVLASSVHQARRDLAGARSR